MCAGFGSLEHKLHPQGDTVRSSCWTSVHQGFGAGRREPEVLLEGKNHLKCLYEIHPVAVVYFARVDYHHRLVSRMTGKKGREREQNKETTRRGRKGKERETEREKPGKDQKLVSADLASLKAKPAKPLMPRNELISYDRKLGSLSLSLSLSLSFSRFSLLNRQYFFVSPWFNYVKSR